MIMAQTVLGLAIMIWFGIGLLSSSRLIPPFSSTVGDSSDFLREDIHGGTRSKGGQRRSVPAPLELNLLDRHR